MGAHVLNDEVLLVVRQVTTGGGAVCGCSSRLAPRHGSGDRLHAISLVEVLVPSTGAALAHQVLPTFGIIT